MITAAIAIPKTREAMRMNHGSPLRPKRSMFLVGTHVVTSIAKAVLARQHLRCASFTSKRPLVH
jgi:hypothetical protein